MSRVRMCDICEKPIYEHPMYRIKEKDVKFVGYECFEVKRNLDICGSCFDRMCRWIERNKADGKS